MRGIIKMMTSLFQRMRNWFRKPKHSDSQTRKFTIVPTVTRRTQKHGGSFVGSGRYRYGGKPSITLKAR